MHIQNNINIKLSDRANEKYIKTQSDIQSDLKQ